MATLLLDTPTDAHRTPDGCTTADVALLRSPIRGAEGAWWVLRQQVSAPVTLAEVLPDGFQVDRIIVNGTTLAPDAYAVTRLLAGDECLILPQWGIPAVLAPYLIYAAVGLAVSVASTALSYVLFPPNRPHQIQQHPDQPT